MTSVLSRLAGTTLRLPLRLIPRGFAMPVVSGPLRGARWIVGAGVHGYWAGTYERFEQDLFVRYLKAGDTVFDLGAHAGFFSLLASKLVGSNGRVTAFEPSRSNQDYFKRHMSLNRAWHNVTLIPAAVSRKSGQEWFIETASSFMGYLASEGGDFKVDVCSLDDVVAKGLAPMPTFMKIDIQGAEVNALLGARDILARGGPTIFLSTHGRRALEESHSLLRSFHYEILPMANSRADEIIAERIRL